MNALEYSTLQQMSQYWLMVQLLEGLKQHTLLNVDLESRDRALVGILPEGITDQWIDQGLEISMTNTTSGETIDYIDISTAHIYESEDELFDDAEFNLYDGDTLSNDRRVNDDIVFVRNEDGLLEFYTTFNEVGELDINLRIGGADGTVITINHTLEADDQLAELIDALADVIAGELPPDITGYPYPDPVSDGFTDPEDPGGGGPILTAAAFSSFSSMALSSLGGESNVQRFRNLLTKTLIPWAKKRVQLGAATGTGIVFGAWDGLYGDIEGIVETVRLILKGPYRIASEFYHTFKALTGMSYSDFEAMVKSAVDGFLEKQEDRVAWVYSGTAEEDPAILGEYLKGYGAGYIGEQVVVALGTGGLIKVGVATRAGKYISGIVNAAKNAGGRLVAQGGYAAKRRFSAAMQKVGSQFAKNRNDARANRVLSDKLSADLTTQGKPVGEVFEDNMRHLDAGPNALTYQKVFDEELFDANKGGLTGPEDRRYMAMLKKMSEFTELVGNRISEDAIRGFVRCYRRLIFPDGETDRFADLAELFKADQLDAGKDSLVKSLEDFKVATDANVNTRFPFRDIENLYPTLHHYANAGTFRYVRIDNGKIIANSNPSGERYVTSYVASGKNDAMDALQLPDNGSTTARWRFDFDSGQTADEINIPRGYNITQNGPGNYEYEATELLEPLVRQNGSFGRGGEPQFIQGSELEVSVFDYEVNRYLTAEEVQSLINEANSL